MKRMPILTMICVLCLLAISILTMRPGAQGLYTDFEEGFGNWQSYTALGGTCQISTAYAHSGTYSVEQFTPATYNSTASIRLPVESMLSQYTLSAWVYVTERTTVNEGSRFGFLYGNEEVHWNAWRDSSSYVGVRQSEGYQVKGSFDNPVPYGLTLNTWHQVKITVYTNLGVVSIWLDGNLIVENWPAFNAGEHPNYYIIYCYSSGSPVHQYIDDVNVDGANVTLTPVTGFASTTVVGTGFSNNSKVTIKWDGTTIPYVPSSLTTDANGDFAALISIPTQSVPGAHTVNATDDSGNSATATFTVVSMKGDTGEQGSQGPQGIQGPKGDQGPLGPPGNIQDLLVMVALPTIVSVLAICLAAVALLKKRV